MPPEWRGVRLLESYPEHVAILVSVELCSLTLQPRFINCKSDCQWSFRRWRSMCCWRWAATPKGYTIRPVVLGSQSRLYPDTEDVMGRRLERWIRGYLKATFHKLAETHLQADVDAFNNHGLTRRIHTGSVYWWSKVYKPSKNL